MGLNYAIVLSIWLSFLAAICMGLLDTPHCTSRLPHEKAEDLLDWIRAEGGYYAKVRINLFPGIRVLFANRRWNSYYHILKRALVPITAQHHFIFRCWAR